jgi:hypothetical protein
MKVNNFKMIFNELFHLIHDTLYQKIQVEVFAYKMNGLNEISMQWNDHQLGSMMIQSILSIAKFHFPSAFTMKIKKPKDRNVESEKS